MPAMQAQKSGSIVNIASVVAVAGQLGYLHDVASKRAVLAMIARTKGLAKEVGQHGASVNMPGFFGIFSQERRPIVKAATGQLRDASQQAESVPLSIFQTAFGQSDRRFSLIRSHYVSAGHQEG